MEKKAKYTLSLSPFNGTYFLKTNWYHYRSESSLLFSFDEYYQEPLSCCSGEFIGKGHGTKCDQ